MRYNKIFQYEKGGIQKRSVMVTDDLKVETKLIPKFGLSLFVKELSSAAKKNEYKRRNSCKFDSTTDRHIYIIYTEPRNNGYEIIKKLIIRRTHGGYFKIPEGTFLYDVLDYFVEVGLLDKDYNFIGHVKDNIGMSVIEIHDEEPIVTTDQLLDKYNDYLLLHTMFGDQYYMNVAEETMNQLRGAYDDTRREYVL